MRQLVAVALTVATALGACGSGNARGARVPDNDQYCDGDKPHAYQPTNMEEAEKAGCVQVRVHMGKKDPTTGEVHDYEDLVYCCPK